MQLKTTKQCASERRGTLKCFGTSQMAWSINSNLTTKGCLQWLSARVQGSSDWHGAVSAKSVA